MRKVEQQIKTAWLNKDRKTVGNTSTDGTSVFLFGNEIIRKNGDKIEINLCGWNTVTTRSRINNIANVGVHQVKGVACIDGKEIDSNKWISVDIKK